MANVSTPTPHTVGDVITLLESAYPPSYAEEWDYPGLVCGDPTAPVERICCAVDVTPEILAAALAQDAHMIISHHPVLFSAVHSVACTTPRGGLIHDAISAGCAIFCAHTNADTANPGVNDALAAALGLTVLRPLIPHHSHSCDQQTASMPEGLAPVHGDTLAAAPGLGRIGTLAQPLSLREFTKVVAEALPTTAWGVRAAGDPDARIATVAVCGGSGGSYLDAARQAGVDCYVTSDLRHHPVDDFLQAGGKAVIDTAHAASEYPWLFQVADLVRGELGIETAVLPLTDPWTLHSA